MLPIALSCAVALAACASTNHRQQPDEQAGSAAGAGGHSGEVTTPGGVASAGSSAASDSGSLAAPPRANGPLADESAGPYDLRRLTQREYRHTVEDLLPGMTDAVAQATAAFPVDELAAHGYVASGSFSAAHVQSLLDAAEAIADAALAAGAIPAECAESSELSVTSVCAADFIRAFGRRAFRRAVTNDEAADLLQLFSAASELGFTFRESVAQLLGAMLQSPNFLYHWEQGDEAAVAEGELIALTSHQLASRLSYLLWETMPDERLLAAADAGQLSTVEQLAAQVERLLNEPARPGAALSTFHRQWLGVQGLGTLAKSQELFPTFTPLVAEALDDELPAFVSAAFATAPGATLQTLLGAPYAYANQASAPLYGAIVMSPAFERIELEPTERAGLLTQAAFLAAHADTVESDPAGRGAVVFERLLCGDDRAAAASLGAAFGNYDAIGVYRTANDGQRVDASGEVVTPLGLKLRFDNAVELMQRLAGVDEVQWCTTRQWFRYGLGRPELPADLGSLQRAYRAGAAQSGFALRDMLSALVQSKAFRYRALSGE